ncbi:MAG: hypothetical protein J5J06_17860 [Phycisphaerae bacterium]|nr:hypothetical protein [Phycisphaerae bacterium]
MPKKPVKSTPPSPPAISPPTGVPPEVDYAVNTPLSRGELESGIRLVRADYRSGTVFCPYCQSEDIKQIGTLRDMRYFKCNRCVLPGLRGHNGERTGKPTTFRVGAN